MAAAVSSTHEPFSTTCTSAALFTDPTSAIPRRAINRSWSDTPALRYFAGLRNTAFARIVRPARHSSSASAASAPITVSDTPPAAGSRHPPTDTRSTRTRNEAPASVANASLTKRPSISTSISRRSTSALSIANPPRRSSRKFRSGGCMARRSAAPPIKTASGKKPTITPHRAILIRPLAAARNVATMMIATSHGARAVTTGSRNTPAAMPAAVTMARSGEVDMPLFTCKPGNSGIHVETRGR